MLSCPHASRPAPPQPNPRRRPTSAKRLLEALTAELGQGQGQGPDPELAGLLQAAKQAEAEVGEGADAEVGAHLSQHFM